MLVPEGIGSMPTWEDFSKMIAEYPAEAGAFALFVLGFSGIFFWWYYRERIAGHKEEIERLKGRLTEGGTSSAQAEMLKQKRLLDKQKRNRDRTRPF
jgi:uncharacterized small protein (DUF1192 family)